MLTARLFGPVEFQLNGEPLPDLAGGRPAALLIYLCVTGQSHARETIANLLWHSKSDQQARSNLRYILRDLRKSVGEYVSVNGDVVALNQNLPCWIDSVTFAHYMGMFTVGVQPENSSLVQQLLDLYTDKFLTGFQVDDAPAFNEWLIGQRRRMHDLFVQGLHLRIHEQMAAGEYAQGLALNQYLLTQEPWREEFHRQRMLLLACQGQPSAAAKQYETCCQVLAEELDVPPMPETTSLYEQIKSGHWNSVRPDSDDGFSALSAAVAPFLDIRPPSPQQGGTSVNGADPGAGGPAVNIGSMPELLHFADREDELTLMRHCIGREHCRLFAVMGLPGAGKSALAAAFVQDVWEDDSRYHLGFKQIIWQSLAHAPTCLETLQSWLTQLDPGNGQTCSTNFDQLINRLFHILDQQSCLLVLDGVEEAALTSTGDAECYDQLFRLFYQREHRSCLLLTSRTRPRSLTKLAERDKMFRWLRLDGLANSAGVDLLTSYGLDGIADDLGRLCQRYVGNPLLLTQAANLIHELFEGDVAAFLQENLYFLGDIGGHLYEYLHSLDRQERRLLQCLAETHTPLDRQTLWRAMQPEMERPAFLLTLHSLQRQFLIHMDKGVIALAPLLVSCFQEHRPINAFGV